MRFGHYIAEVRKKRGLSQKELAGRVRKEGGAAISPQYLNDIESGRRQPSSDYLLAEFARELGADLDYLYWLIAQFPPDVRDTPYSLEQVQAALKALRRELQQQES